MKTLLNSFIGFILIGAPAISAGGSFHGKSGPNDCEEDLAQVAELGRFYNKEILNQTPSPEVSLKWAIWRTLLGWHAQIPDLESRIREDASRLRQAGSPLETRESELALKQSQRWENLKRRRERSLNVCLRHPAVQNAILFATGKFRCEDVSEEDLRQITTISLVGKESRGLRRGDFAGMDNLKDLRILMLDIPKLNFYLFSDLPSLERLEVSASGLESLDLRGYRRPSRLKSLILFNNKLKSLPDGFSAYFGDLEELDLGRNPIQFDSAGPFQGLLHLVKLSLENCGLTEIGPNFLLGVPKLEELILSRNSIVALDENALQFTPALKGLFLDHNQLESLPGLIFRGLSNLLWLDLSFNRLSRLDEGIFQDLLSLKTLDVKRNQIERLTRGHLKNLAKLQTLLAGRNRLSEISGDLISDLPHLSQLGLEENLLREIPNAFLRRSLNLNTLDFGYNRIESVPRDLFFEDLTLRFLSLAGNQLLKGPSLWPLRRLHTARLGGNPLSWYELSRLRDQATYIGFQLDLSSAIRQGD